MLSAEDRAYLTMRAERCAAQAAEAEGPAAHHAYRRMEREYRRLLEDAANAQRPTFLDRPGAALHPTTS